MQTLKFNYAKLRGRMAELGYTGKEIAVHAGMTPATFSIKMNNNGEFSQTEIFRIMDILKISIEEVWIYFFTLKV